MCKSNSKCINLIQYQEIKDQPAMHNDSLLRWKIIIENFIVINYMSFWGIERLEVATFLSIHIVFFV